MNKTREELVADLQQRVADHILEPTNAALLERLIMQAVDDNEAVMIASLGTTYKRTGLHFDKRLERPTPEIHYLRRNKALSFGDGETPHRLIIGDNLHALQNLLIQYRGQVDVIYIDPPYGKDSMGEFAETNYENAITRDNLLSMLHPRLMLARQLLSDSGVIFCSIDDRNQAYVKCLFDDVFGERNFIATICREVIKGGTKTKNIKPVHDYIILFAKQLTDGSAVKDILLGEEFAESFKYIYQDEKGKYAKGRELNKWGAGSRREDSPSMWYPIPGPNGEDVYPVRNDGSDGRWRWGRKKLLEAVVNGDVIFDKRDDGSWIVYEKVRKDKVKNKQLVSVLKDDFINAKGSEDLKEIFNTLMSPFDYAKPVSLIEYLLQSYPYDDAVVLDFFAGSGTTGQAVLELNRQDGGNRRFILCQLNEVTDTTPNGIAHDVTAKRLKRVMTGECYDGMHDFAWAQKNQPYGGSLEVADIATVADFNARPGQSAFDVIDETLYGQQRFERMEKKVDWVCRNFEPTQVSLEGDQEWRARRMEADQR